MGSTLWTIADKLRGAMNADDFRDYMLSFLFLRYLSDNYEEAVKKELGSDYQKSELEIQKNGEDLDSYIGELKSVITQYSRSLSPEKLGLHEDEEDHQKIEKARQDFVDDNNKMLYSHNVIPLAVWYIRNLDQVEMLEKQMRRKIHYVIKPAYLWSNIYELARTQNSQLLKTLQSGFKYIENGVLFRGGAEEKIRTKLLKEGNIDAVIGLPANLFFSTGIPVCILVLKKCKKYDDVLIINASEYFEKGKRQNTLLPKHIDKIIETYQYRKEEDKKYSRRVSMEEIEKNGYNLNISRYVSTAPEEEIIDLEEVRQELEKIESDISQAKTVHNEFLKELGLKLLP